MLTFAVMVVVLLVVALVWHLAGQPTGRRWRRRRRTPKELL